MSLNRRDFLKLAGIGGAVFLNALPGVRALARGNEGFYFVQLTDTHWGFDNAKFNAQPRRALERAIEAVNALDPQPDFVVFTGDLTHTTDDPDLRRKRMGEFRDIVGALRNKNVRFMPGEHDASLDAGKAYEEFFGDLRYTFDHRGIHFIALDNVSDPQGQLGAEQLRWLERDLEQLDKSQPVVVLAHRPLFDLKPQWGWATLDGTKAVDLLKPFKHVTVFYGHIHREHHHRTGHIAHHSARSLIFTLPDPQTHEQKFKVPWDAEAPFKGLGLRNVEVSLPGASLELYELSIEEKT